MIRLKYKPDQKEINTRVEYLNWREKTETLNDISGYFDKDGQEFLYFNSIFIIPERFPNLHASDIVEDELVFDNWELIRKTNIRNKGYTINEFKRGLDYLHRIKEIEEDLTGDWILKENLRGDVIGFSLLKEDKYSYDDYYYVCFPEKTTIPYKEAMIDRKTKFIVYLIWKKLLSEKS